MARCWYLSADLLCKFGGVAKRDSDFGKGKVIGNRHVVLDEHAAASYGSVLFIMVSHVGDELMR